MPKAGIPRVGRGSVLARVERALRDAGVTARGRLVVAVSGGPDSMVLLDVVARLRDRLGLRMVVAHVHHGLRGRAADRDAALVVAEAAARGLSVTVARLSPESRRRGESLQMWARQERYAALEAIREATRAAHVITAHTEDDQAETVLLNLLRGTGPLGLAGIPRARGSVLRPLLEVGRAEVEAYAASRGVAFRRDASNRSDAYLRNRIRRRLLPLLGTYNPRIVESLAALAGLLREDEATLALQAAALFRQAAFEEAGAIRLDAAAVYAAGPALRRRVIQEAFRRVAARPSLTRRHVRAVEGLLAREGRLALPAGVVARREDRELRIGPAARAGGESLQPAGGGEVRVRPGSWTSWRPGGCHVRVRRVAQPARITRRGGTIEVLSERLLAQPLRLRGWRAGDRFRPLGLAGQQKKLQDFFVDAKVARAERPRVPLLLAGEEIAWVVGHRIAEAFRWEGRGPGCLVEVRFDRRRDTLPARPQPD